MVGSQGIRFAALPGTTVMVLGYRGERGFDGEHLVSCTDTVGKPIAMPDGDTVAAECHSGEVASGGLWLTGQDTACGSGCGVLQRRDRPGVRHLFDADTEHLYHQADQP